MKKIIVVVLLSFSLFIMNVSAKKEESKEKYLALGDSITYGYSLENPEEQAYPYLIAKKYNLEVTNEGVSGDTSTELLERIKNYNVNDYDYITVCIGANDILGVLEDAIAKKYEESDKNFFEVTEFVKNIESDTVIQETIDTNLEIFEDNLKKLLDILKTSNAKIYFMNIYNPYKNITYANLNAITDSYVKKINNTIENIVTNYPIIDIYTEFENNKGKIIFTDTDYLFDPHPNEEGQKVIAKILGLNIFGEEKINYILIAVLAFAATILLVGEIFVVRKLYKKQYSENKNTIEKEVEELKNKEISKNEDKNGGSRFSRN